MSTTAHPRAQTSSIPWIRYGIEAGIVGALVVVAVLAVWDVVLGHPLYTPAALGTALFTGELLARGGSVHPAVVLGYTLVHGGLFVGGGVLIGALVEAFTYRKEATIGMGVLLTGLIFLIIEASFVAFHGLFLVPGLLQELGVGVVGAANAFAAVGMSTYLMGRRRADHES